VGNYTGRQVCCLNGDNVYIGCNVGDTIRCNQNRLSVLIGGNVVSGSNNYICCCFSRNVAIGALALCKAGCHGGTCCQYNIAIGAKAGEFACCLKCDILIGTWTGRYRYASTGTPLSNNIYIGSTAGQYAYPQCGGYTIGIGYQAMYWGGYDNIGIGFYAGRFNCQCIGGKGKNVLIGGCAGYYIGCSNTSAGFAALYSSRNALGNTAVGAFALYCLGYSAAASYSIAVGYAAGKTNSSGTNNASGCFNLYLGRESKSSSTTGHWQYAIGSLACAGGANTMTIGNSSVTMQYYCGCMVKSGGSFRIVHPNPEKKDKFLYHSFVESPTAGDNLYRWSFNVSNCEHCFKLPNYYKYLNECNMAWVYPADHFGEGHAKLDEEKENLIIKTNKDGCYNVLLIGTRCDEFVKRKNGGWRGTEVDMTEQEIKSNYDKNKRICSLLPPTKYNDSHTP